MLVIVGDSPLTASNIPRSWRIESSALRVVGDPHRVMAGTDCGFERTSGMGHVAEELVWEKLRALRAGAALASKRLF